MTINARKRRGRQFAGLDLPPSYRAVLGKSALLSETEEQDLAKQIREGDREARNRMIYSNMRLVIPIALRYRGLGLSDTDLIGEGNCGLIRAVDAYLPGKGARFATYATYHIKLAVRSAITQHAYTIRIPERLILLMSAWREASEAIWRTTGKRATNQQISNKLGLTRLQTARVLQAMRIRRVASIGVAGENDPFEGELIAPTDTMDRVDSDDEIECLRNRLDKLDDRAKAILCARYGLGQDTEPQSLRRIGQKSNLSREWIRQIQDRAIDNLAESMCCKHPHG